MQVPGSINKSISKQKLRLHSRYASTTYVSYLTNLLHISKEDTLTEPQIVAGKKELNETAVPCELQLRKT